jgi:hypothetical protein
MACSGRYCYVIVPTADVETDGEPTNYEMLNSSVANTYDDIKVSDDGNFYLFEMRSCRESVFDGYVWYSLAEILVVLAGENWDGV